MMTWSRESQERWKSGATVASLLAVPVLIAVGGWWIQRQVSQEGIKQQYVQLAIDILSAAPRANDESRRLRTWAIGIVDQYAPVKLTPETKDLLENDVIVTGTRIATPPPVRILSLSVCDEYFAITKDKEGAARCRERLRVDTETKP